MSAKEASAAILREPFHVEDHFAEASAGIFPFHEFAIDQLKRCCISHHIEEQLSQFPIKEFFLRMT
jgi:hypothetical protein